MQNKVFEPLRACRMARGSQKISRKKSVSQSTRNALKRIEMPKKNFFYPYDRIRVKRRSTISERKALIYLPHFTRRVPRSVHAKFHADWTKTVGTRGIHPDKKTELF